MDTSNNIVPFLGTFIPAAFYAAMLYSMMPRRSVNLTHLPLFFITGIVTTIFIKYVYFIFPVLRNLLEPVQDAFFLTAPLEETMKMIGFLMASRYYKPKNAHEFVFTYMSLGCGFAMAENFTYIAIHGPGVLVIRAFTALFLHMSAGILAGRMWSDGNKSLALILPILLHGSYNATVEIDLLSWMLVGVCITVGILCCRDLFGKK